MRAIWSKLKEIFIVSGTEGFLFPHVYDAAHKRPSLPLLFVVISFGLSIGSILALHFSASMLTATLTAIGFFALCYILSMFKEIDKFKANLKERSFEVDDSGPKQDSES